MARKKLNFEDAFSRLEEIADLLDNDISIDESLKLYKEGIEISVFLDKELKTAKKEVLVLKEQADGLFKEIPFDTEGEEDYE
jgi:exodeoxyribonuclease VII small subunit